MNQPHKARARAPQTLRILLAGLCVLLILFIGVAQVLHTHTDAEVPGCSLCAVAHLSVLTAPVSATPVAVETTAPLRASEIAPAPPRLFSFSTYVRPPPALTSRS